MTWLNFERDIKFWKLYLWKLPTEGTWQFVFMLFSYKKWLWSSKQSLPLSSPHNPPYPKENSVEQTINSSCSWRLKPVFDTFAQQAESKSTINFFIWYLFILKLYSTKMKMLIVLEILSSRKTSISALLTMPKLLTVWITINCGKFWKRWAYQTT